MGWRRNHPDQLQEDLDSSMFIATAYDGDKAVGMATAEGTVLLIPEYQFQGIENEMMNHVFDFLRTKLKPGYGIQLNIRAWNEKQIALYESLGFQVSTPEKRGVPMHICLTDQIEMTDKMFKQMDFKE
jgi:GNAT superfamily N-acetyltransferase